MGFSRARWWAVFGAAVAGLGVASALDPGGIRKFRALAADVARMEKENRALAAENDRMAREVRALRTEPEALERAVREELYFVRPGERVYLLDAPAPATGERR